VLELFVQTGNGVYAYIDDLIVFNRETFHESKNIMSESIILGYARMCSENKFKGYIRDIFIQSTFYHKFTRRMRRRVLSNYYPYYQALEVGV